MEEDETGNHTNGKNGTEGGNGWKTDVGSATNDEDNVGGYWRFGDKEDGDSRKMVDLSKYNNGGVLLGENVRLSATSSPCDEGEEGKIKLLYDIIDGAFGVVCNRGGSLDVGFGHATLTAKNENNKNRLRCSIELWVKPVAAEEQSGVGEEGECSLIKRAILREGEGLDEGFEDSKRNMWKMLLNKKTR